MPNMICIGAININCPQQNAGVFIGEINCGGWDANQKQNQGFGALNGLFNFVCFQSAYLYDNFELIDGLMNDADFKPLIGMNI